MTHHTSTAKYIILVSIFNMWKDVKKLEAKKEACSCYLSYLITAFDLKSPSYSNFEVVYLDNHRRQVLGKRKNFKEERSSNKTVFRIFKFSFFQWECWKIASTSNISCVFKLKWHFKVNKKTSVKNFKTRKHSFVQLTIAISEIYYSRKSDVRMMRKRTSNGHFLGKQVFVSPWKR